MYHRRRRTRIAMGDLASTLSTAADVVSDPYFPEVLCRIQQLKAVDHGQAVPDCASTPDTEVSGVGLKRPMPLLRAYVFAQQNPWMYPVAALAVFGLPFLLGYELGKGRK